MSFFRLFNLRIFRQQCVGLIENPGPFLRLSQMDLPEITQKNTAQRAVGCG